MYFNSFARKVKTLGEGEMDYQEHHRNKVCYCCFYNVFIYIFYAKQVRIIRSSSYVQLNYNHWPLSENEFKYLFKKIHVHEIENNMCTSKSN